MAKRARELPWVPFKRTLIPFRRLHPHDLIISQRLCFLKTIILEVRISAYGFAVGAQMFIPLHLTHPNQNSQCPTPFSNPLLLLPTHFSPLSHMQELFHHPYHHTQNTAQICI
jgi:hypothetical protein